MNLELNSNTGLLILGLFAIGIIFDWCYSLIIKFNRKRKLGLREKQRKLISYKNTPNKPFTV